MTAERISPSASSVERLVVGGESFAEESRMYLAELWGCDVYNTYGSTEGTMCGECGRVVLTTLLPVGGKCGTLLLNYDTDDTTVVISRDRCACGRTHMRIMSPQRESETFWIAETPFNRVDVERGVFQPENMEYLTGEYEAFLYGGDDEGETTMRVSVECLDSEKCGQGVVEENFLRAFFTYKPRLAQAYADNTFKIIFNFTGPESLELYRVKGRPKRIVDRR
jgi:phenylacetate-coenzyme A ligase PaaK-like adenylate-forming protein